MNKQKLISAAIGIILLAGVTGCSSDQSPQGSPPPTSTPSSQASAQNQPTTQPAKPINTQEVADKVTKTINEKFPGSWKVEGTTLSKGDYTENEKYDIAKAVGKEFSDSMVSIFVGQDRISSTVIGKDGKPVSSGYAVPTEIAETLKSGKVTTGKPSDLGGVVYQKVFIPLKEGDKTVAVISVSVSQ